MRYVLMILFIVVIIILIAAGITNAGGKSNKPRNRRKKKADYSIVNPPAGLNFRPEMPLQALGDRFEQGLSASFLVQLKRRVMDAQPNLSSAEYEWKLFELKRYLANRWDDSSYPACTEDEPAG